MKVQLLILLALTGPLCGITRATCDFLCKNLRRDLASLRNAHETGSRSCGRAGPTGLPTELEGTPDAAAEVTVPPGGGDLIVLNGAPSEAPEAVPTEVATKAAPEATSEDSMGPALEVTTGPATGFTTEAATARATADEAFTTAAAGTDATDAATVATTEPMVGLNPTPVVPVLQSSAPTAAEAAEKTSGGDANVVVEDEGLSSGQVVGVVIGALIAVVIFIAVVIALVRRMGKYSP